VKPTYQEDCRTSTKNPPDVILVGEASWGGGEKSVKYGWYDIRGRLCRGGEVPLEAVPQMLEVAIREGGLKLEP
jgi:hypothetical protein